MLFFYWRNAMKNKRIDSIMFEYRNKKKYYCDKCIKKDVCDKPIRLCIKEGIRDANRSN